MKIYINCKCGFSITPDMQHAVSTGICPGCGEKLDVEDLPSAFMLIDIIKELKLPLTSTQIKALLDAFLIKKLNMTFPPITLIDETPDKLRAAATHAPQQEANDPQETNEASEDDFNLPPLPPIGPDGKRTMPKKSNHTSLPKDKDLDPKTSLLDDGPGIDISDEEASRIKKEMAAERPIALPPDPKKFSSTSDGVTFFDKDSFTSRGPMLHSDIGHTLKRPGEK